MRWLFGIVLGLAVLYGGYWFVGARMVEAGAERFLAGLEADGVEVRYADLSLHGFPSRFDTTLSDFSFDDPATGIGWSAPFVQVFALSYQPNRIIAVWPDSQQIRLPGQTVTLAADRLRASASAAPNRSLPLRNLTVESGAARLVSDLGWTVSLTDALAALRNNPAGGPAYDLWLKLDGVAPPEPAMRALDPAGARPSALSLLQIDAAVALDQPIDRAMAGPPLIQRIDLRSAELHWGEMLLQASGELAPDGYGLAEGRILLRVTDWRGAIEAATNAGMIAPEFAPTWLSMAENLAQGSETVELPLVFRNGGISFGLFQLGPAPRLR